MDHRLRCTGGSWGLHSARFRLLQCQYMVRVNAENQVLNASRVDRSPTMADTRRDNLDVTRPEPAAAAVLQGLVASEAGTDCRRNGVSLPPIDERARYLRPGAPQDV